MANTGKTLGQLRQQTYNLIREDNPLVVTTNPNTHFPDQTVIDGFLNEGCEFSAVFIEYPRDLVSITTQNNVGSYANPVDNLVLRTAYFGDPTLPGDVRPIKIISEETLKEYYPSWLDQSTAGTASRPVYLIQKDRLTVHIFPRPNVDGKLLILNYNYNPAPMVNDSDVPDLPIPYHDLLPLYAIHLAYYALQNSALSAQMYKDFMEKVMRLKSAVTKESKEQLSMSWGTDENFNSGLSGSVIP